MSHKNGLFATSTKNMLPKQNKFINWRSFVILKAKSPYSLDKIVDIKPANHQCKKQKNKKQKTSERRQKAGAMLWIN